MMPEKLTLLWKVLLVFIFFRPFLSEYTYPLLGLGYTLALMLLSVSYLFAGPGPIIPHTRFNLPVLLFLLALLLSMFFSLSWRWGIRELYWFLPNILIFWVAAKSSQPQRQQLIYALISAAGIICIYGFFQYYFGFSRALEYLAQTNLKPHLKTILEQKRVLATFISPNIFASYLLMMLFMGAGVLINSAEKTRLSLRAVLPVSLFIVSLVLTKSYGAIAAAVITVFFLLVVVCLSQPVPSKKKSLLWIILIAITLIITSSIWLLKERPENLFNFKEQHNSIVQRLYYWKASWAMIKDHPITGIGWRNFGYAYKAYKPAAANISHFSHNVFLQVMAETGILGLVSFSWIIIIFVRSGLTNLTQKAANYQPLYIGIFCAGLAFLLHNLIDLSFYYSQAAFFWWIILGFLSTAGNR